MGRKRRSSLDSGYFTQETDAKIREFLATKDPEERNAIFDAGIRPAFEKLIESIIHVYGFYSLGDIRILKMECLTNLYEIIPRFDPDRGTKGFSYFNAVAKNWFIHQLREKRRRDTTEQEDVDVDFIKNDSRFSEQSHLNFLEKQEQLQLFLDDISSWRDIVTRPSDKQVLEAFIFMFKNPELVQIHNRKAIYLYFRDMTGLNTKAVVAGIKVLRELYERWKKKYQEDEEAFNDRP